MEAESNYIDKEKAQRDGVYEEEEVLKRRISSHPLYGLLVETHMKCLKVGVMGDLNPSHIMNFKGLDNNCCLGLLNQSELDRFMEAYCFALMKLKEAMEEPQLKSIEFIDSMHSQLRELTRTHLGLAEPLETSSSNES